MDKQMRGLIDKVKKQVCQQANGIAMLNKSKLVSGIRHILPLAGRDIEIVYYSAKAKEAPLLIGFHGGGFLFGGCAMDDEMWSTMCQELGVNIASIGYRKTPDYPYPYALEDAYDSAVYLKEHANEFRFDKNHISTFGNSAGANLAASLCILAKERGGICFKYQILNYPFLDCATSPIDKGDSIMEAPIMFVFNELYCTHEESKNPTVSPVYATKEQLEGLPKTIICLAENDTLRREGEVYAHHLHDAGVEVVKSVAQGMPHAYFEYAFSNATEFISEDVKNVVESGAVFNEARYCLAFIKANYNI